LCAWFARGNMTTIWVQDYCVHDLIEGNMTTVLGSGLLRWLLCLEQLNTIMAVMYCECQKCCTHYVLS
jgi:hypothetical protein